MFGFLRPAKTWAGGGSNPVFSGGPAASCRPWVPRSADLTLDLVVVGLFEQVMELQILHNYFALWMMVPSPALLGSRPVDLRRSGEASTLFGALERTLTDGAA